jgi:hypothetical protein
MHQGLLNKLANMEWFGGPSSLPLKNCEHLSTYTLK